VDGERHGRALSGSRWRRRGGRLAVGAVYAQIGVQLLFASLLLLGERARLGFMALYAPRQPLLVLAVVGFGVALVMRRRVLAAVQLGVAALVLFPVMGLHLGGASTSDRPVRLATYNVYFGKLGRPQLDDELAAMPADIIVIQAAYDSLGNRLRARFPDRTVHQSHELILVTRFPIREVEEPPALFDDTRPMFVTYVLETPRGPLTVTNIHPFSPRHALFGEADAALDLRQREAQLEAAVASARRRGPPFLIAGDSNLPHLSAFARRHFDGLDDAFAAVGFGFGYTFPAKRPWMRIDRVLLGPGVRPVEARVGPKGASDHLPLAVTLEIVH
jgi:vancomycin resistance protein VanJ